jgi:radical SAM superfamily enzyme YgiQ (UPF0313 family)
MRIHLLSVEDGLDNIGFRKVSAYTRSLYHETKIHYVTPGYLRSTSRIVFTRVPYQFGPSDFEAIAKELDGADVVGFSCMTQYSSVVADIIASLRRVSPKTFVVWGGIHPIIDPEDAIKYADAICTGEGEFAFRHFLEAYGAGKSYADTASFWFNTSEGVVKNRNLPLMTNSEMDALPLLTYQDGELIYKGRQQGFVPITAMDYVAWSGLAYNTVWSIGCPMRCSYCGNSAFIDYDASYRKIRHSAPATIIHELNAAIAKHPHLSNFVFHDDSFIALPLEVLAEFAALYKAEIGKPFAVFGTSPNYIREDKVELLIRAGMNRVRMGIQSGSPHILEFYNRHTPVHRIREACAVLNKFSRFMIPPSYDIILDNPVETPEDTRATLDLLYDMPKPYTLNLFSLKVIPNTRMATDLKARGIEVEGIRKSYLGHAATLGNAAVYLITLVSLPKACYRWLHKNALPSHLDQNTYPRFTKVLRRMFVAKRAFDHLRFMDFTSITGRVGYTLWKLGIVGARQRHLAWRASAPDFPKDDL